ncbi:hypothetical protein EI94DRAFT_1700478 [Lactarius quietus]|nr:hypothetical protein EI94DRAFT_1700478 [Lactarius quietus]
MSPPNDPEAQTGVEASERQLENTAERRLGDSAKNQGSAENYGDPSGKLWSMYLTEAKKEDEQITNNWTEDTGGVLVFTGLFSSIIATFISISLPGLSPDPNAPTVALLTQLVNISSGVPVVPQNTPFTAPASIVRVNVMWFLSLILSLSCALLATLMQQWARRYMDYARHGGAPRKQARIRAYMFEGVTIFRMSQAVEAMPLLLHTSVFLFFAGLIEFLFTINNAVARYTLSCVVFFASIYAILTLLSNFSINCPYRTPLSVFTYFSFQLSASCLLFVTNKFEGIFHTWLVSHLRGSSNTGLTKWRAGLEEKVDTYYKRLSHSLRWRVVDSAMKAPPGVDTSALHWTLTTLEEHKKVEEFAAYMPGFFDSNAPPDATSAMLSLMSERSGSEPILGSRLRELLNSCRPGTSLLTKEQRNHRLRVCLKSLWHCLKAYNLPKHAKEPLAPYVRSIFASPEVFPWIRAEEDPAIRLLRRCFGALIVKKLASDMASRTDFTDIVAKMDCLSYILGATIEQVRAWFDRGAIDLANVISFTSGEMALLSSGTDGVPADVVDVFQETLRILGEGMVSGIEWDADQVTQFRQIYFRLANAPIPDVLIGRLGYILDILLPRTSESDMEDPEVMMPTPQLNSETTSSFPGPPQNFFVIPRIGDVRDSGIGDGIGTAPT